MSTVEISVVNELQSFVNIQRYDVVYDVCFIETYYTQSAYFTITSKLFLRTFETVMSLRHNI